MPSFQTRCNWDGPYEPSRAGLLIGETAVWDGRSPYLDIRAKRFSAALKRLSAIPILEARDSSEPERVAVRRYCVGLPRANLRRWQQGYAKYGFIGRIVAIDAEANSVPFLKGLEQGHPGWGWVTRLKPSLLEGKGKYFGHARMEPLTFLDRVATLPARLRVLPEV